MKALYFDEVFIERVHLAISHDWFDLYLGVAQGREVCHYVSLHMEPLWNNELVNTKPWAPHIHQDLRRCFLSWIIVDIQKTWQHVETFGNKWRILNKYAWQSLNMTFPHTTICELHVCTLYKEVFKVTGGQQGGRLMVSVGGIGCWDDCSTWWRHQIETFSA